MTKTLSEIRIEVEEARKVLNAAILDDKFSEINAAKTKLNQKVKEYNEEAITLDFCTLRSKSAPMKEAIEQLNIATIATKENQNKETGIITYSLESSSTQISLPEFEEFCSRDKIEIGHAANWQYMAEKLCLLVTYRVAKSLNLSTKKLEDTYFISEVARQIDLGATPVSNSQLLKQVQTIVDAIIFEDNNGQNIYKVTSHDVNYIVQAMTKRGKSGTIITPRVSFIIQLIMDVLHRIITNGDYKVKYHTKKDVKEEQEAANKTEKEAGEDMVKA